MKVVIAIATFKGRESYLKKTLESLQGQADEIRIYDNEKRFIDLTDNGKFYFLHEYKEPVYYFTCDDDIIYPPTYVQDMIEAIERAGTIVTHHGRKLIGEGLSYYRGHKAYQCLRENHYEGSIDVSGTGVTAFRTDYFNPINIWASSDKRMSDLVFSLEASRKGKDITVLKHSGDYFRYQNVPANQTIHGTESRRETRQIEIANEIWKRKKC
jgi:hypothetical protein